VIRHTHSRPALFPLFPVIIALLFHACAPEAPNVDLSATGGTVPGSSPGTEYLQVESIYPDAPLPATDRFPVDTDVVIMFSKPVNMADITAGNIVIPGAPAFGVPTSFSGGKGVRIPFAGNFAYSSTYTITIDPTAIRDSGGDLGVAGPNDAAEFTTSTDTIADYDPVVITASRYPIDPGPFSRGVGYVVVSFNKAVTSVTAATFTIAPAAASGVPFFSPDEKTWYLPLNTLTYAQVYTVDLDDTVGPGGIEDLGGRDLVVGADNTWTFTVEADPNPGGPITIGSVWLSNVTQNSVRINWTTTRPATGFTVNYGLTTAYGSNVPEAGTPTVHYADLGPGLNSATKYYFLINNATIPTYAASFMTANDSIPTVNDNPVSDRAPGNKSGLAVLQHHTNFTFNRSSYAFWKDGGDNNIYGYYFDTVNPPTNPSLWGADGASVDSNNRTNLRAFTDFMGYAILTFEGGGTIYAKRIYNNAGALGFYGNGWGSAPADAGLNVATGANPRAVLVYGGEGNNNVDGGFVQKIVTTGAAPNSTTMNIPANPFYDFDVDLSVATIINGDYVYNATTHTVTTINKAGQNYRHVLGQTAALIASGTNYSIANIGTTYGPFTTTNHNMYVAGALNNGTNRIYTPHLAAAPIAWTTVAGNLVNAGATWAAMTSRATYNNASTTGTADFSGSLIDIGANFTGVPNIDQWDIVIRGSWAVNADIDVIYDNELALLSDIFPTNQGENYEIYNYNPNAWGTLESISGTEIYDADRDFVAAGVVIGDVILRDADRSTTTVAGIIDANTLDLATQIFSAGEDYTVIDQTPLASGTTDRQFHLVDVGAAFGAGVVGYRVVNTTSSAADYVTARISNHILQLGSDIFPNGTEGYQLYSDWCTLHPPPPNESFYRFNLEWNAGIGAGASATLYRFRAGGTADAGRTNPLYQNAVDFTAVAFDDIVVNVTGWTYARVNNEAYDWAGALGLTANIMANLDNYWILRFLAPAVATEPLTYIGRVTGIAGTQFTSTTKSANFTTPAVEAGDLVYNITQNRYAVVTSVDGVNSITLNRAVFAVNDYFIIVASNEPLIETGVVSAFAGNAFDSAAGTVSFTTSNVRPGDIVHNNTTNADAVVITVNDADTLTLNAPIMAVGDRYVVLSGRIFFAYERGGDIYGKIIRLRDGSTYGAEITICNVAGVQDSVYVLDRGFRNNTNGGSYVVYRHVPTGAWYAKRIGGSGAIVAADNTANGGLGVLVAPAGCELKNIISNNNGAFYILYKQASGTSNLYLQRIDTALAVQWTTAAIANVEDAVMCISPGDNRINIAYSRTSQVYAQRFDFDGTNNSGFAETVILAITPDAYAGGLSISSDGATGAIISWFDERYYYTLGFVLMAQAVDITGARLWDADASAAFDYDGVLIGIPNAWRVSELGNASLFYNDGGSPYGGLFLWYDYRNGRADIFYDTRTNP